MKLKAFRKLMIFAANINFMMNNEMKDCEILTLEKEFTNEHGIKHVVIYCNMFAYMLELTSSNGKTSFCVFNRLKTAKMPVFEKWNFKNDKEAIRKFNSIKK